MNFFKIYLQNTKKINLYIFVVILIYYILSLLILKDVLYGKNIMFPYALNKFYIDIEYPEVWIKIKAYFYIINIVTPLTILLIYNLKKYTIWKKLYIKELKEEENENFFKLETGKKKLKENNTVINKLFKEKREYKDKEEISNEVLEILIGFNEQKQPIYLDEKALFQNILITGSIGTGKTSSGMYNITKQLISYNSYNDKKMGMLILDVKGNYYDFVRKEAIKNGRLQDLVCIDISGGTYYNPIDKTELSSDIIAGRLKEILLLFSKNNTESFWIDKAGMLLSEVIKFIRLYNENYVTFYEIHKIINDIDYYLKMKKNIKTKLIKNKYSEEDIFNINSSVDYIEKEFLKLDERTKGIIIAEISRITGIFVLNYDINRTFCPEKNKINFKGFRDVIDNGKIVVLKMNISKYGDISRIIASYLKMDFQREVLMQVTRKNKENIRKTAFISDGYQEYITKNDAEFYAQSRETMCINVVATQSYSSLYNTLKDEFTTDVIIQSLVNKIWYRQDDIRTIEKAQKVIGKEEKEKVSQTMSESSKEANYNYILKKFVTQNSNLSESINKYKVLEEKFDVKEFSYNLKVFEAIALISYKNKNSVLKIKMLPYFLEENFKI